MRRLFLSIILSVIVLSAGLAAAISYDSPFSSYNTHVPQGTEKFEVFAFTLQGSGIDETLTSITIKNTSDDVEFGDGIDAVYLYLDEDRSGDLDTDTDSLLSFVSFSSNPSTAILNLSDEGETLTTENSKQFIIAYDIGSDAVLGDSANLTLSLIQTGASSLDMTTITDEDTPTSNDVTITGISSLTTDTSIVPDIAIPGQEGVAILYFSVEIVGENIDDDNVVIQVENRYNNFDVDNNDTGITAVYLYRENTPVSNSEDRAFNENNVTLIEDIFTFSDSSIVTFNISNDSAFTTITPAASENYWIVYDLGEDMSVTDDTVIAAQITSFEGEGFTSDELLMWPTDADDLEEPSEVNVAGLSLVEINNIVPDDVIFGASTSGPIMSFKLRSNHTASTLNSVTIVNTGNVGFFTDSNDSDGISLIEIYEDTDRNEDLNEDDDTRVAYSELPSNNTGTFAVVDIAYEENSVERNGFLIDAFDEDADDRTGYLNNNDALFFVIYHFGENTGKDSSESDLSAIARLGNTAASINIVLNTFGDEEEIGITLSDYDNDNPATANPEAEIEISSEINLSVVDVTEISPASVIEGQIRVPVLSIYLQSDATFPSASFTISNPRKSFLENNRGVTQVWIYSEDPDEVDYAFDDDEDTFMSATSTFESTSTAILSGVSIDEGDNYYLVLYDYGMNAVDNSDDIQARLSSISGDEENSTTLILAGNLPDPAVPESITVEEALFDSISLEISEIDDGDSVSYNVALTITNNTAEAIVVESLIPKVYLDDISGNDISYQFDSNLESGTLPFTITAGDTETLDYIMGHDVQISDGTAIIDAFLRYQVTTTMNAKRERYLSTDDDWVSAVVNVGTISLTQTDSTEYYEFPSHIEEVNVIRSSSTVDFEQFDAIKSGDDFVVEFKDSGSFISEPSIEISLNGDDLTVSDYSYEEDTGLLTIEETGTTDGTIVLNVDDVGGNALDTTTIYYSLNSDLEIITPLFYPNPYVMGESDLTLGFNITQPATISYYLYDHNGVRVHSGSESFLSIGYNTISFDQEDSYLAPGVYVLKMVGEDDDGNKVTSKARLAIY